MKRSSTAVRSRGKRLPVMHSRPPLARMIRLHQKIQAGAFPNCRKLAEEFEVSAKTIQRDIDFMRDRLHYPIQWDQAHLGFYLTEPVSGSLPGMEISEGEVVALFVAQKALEQYRGTSFEKPLRAAFQKISEGLAGQIRFQWSDVDAAISFRGLGATIADLELFETASRAVLDSHELTFDYRKLRSSRYEARRIQPYHLGCVENQWYLFGHDLARRQLRTFASHSSRHAYWPTRLQCSHLGRPRLARGCLGYGGLRIYCGGTSPPLRQSLLHGTRTCSRHHRASSDERLLRN